MKSVKHRSCALKDSAIDLIWKWSTDMHFCSCRPTQIVDARQVSLQVEFFPNVHVGIFRETVNKSVDRITFPYQSHTKPQDTQAFLKLLASADRPDQTRDNEAP